MISRRAFIGAVELDGAFAEITKERITRLLVLADPLTVRNRSHIVELAARPRRLRQGFLGHD